MTSPVCKLTFVLLAAAFAAATSASALPNLSPTPGNVPLGVSRTDVDDTRDEACAGAKALLDEACGLHGPITYSSICGPIYAPGGGGTGQICSCTATTLVCGVGHPF